ncbi:unnamed protein product [Lota lota]
MFSSSHMNGFVNPGLSDQGDQAQPPHREMAVDCPGDKEGGDSRPPRCGAQMERIQHYQEELRKRREEEGGGRARHEVDPNASLRLKKLSQNPKVGIDNPTFDGKERPPEHGPDPAAELEEMLQALHWAQRCLTDTQSQQDVELVLQLLSKEEFRTAHSVHSAVSRQMSRAGPTAPLTAQAQGLCQEVGPLSISHPQYPSLWTETNLKTL